MGELNSILEINPDWNLPKELLVYLSNQDSQIEFHTNEPYQVDFIKLNNINELSEIEMYISTWEYRVNQGLTIDPNIEEDGMYYFKVVDLVKEVNDYSNYGIISWIPDLQQFGTFDCDHGVVYIFKDVTWNQIIDNIFINL